MKTNLKRFIVLIFSCLNISYASSQNVETISHLLTLSVGQQDTILFSLRDYFGPTSTQVYPNVPDNANFSGNYRVLVEKVSGSASDSLAILNKPGNQDSKFIVSVSTADLDSVWVYGSSFTTYANVGDGRVYGKPIIASHYPLVSLFMIVKMGDLTGGNRIWRFSIVKDK